MEAASLILWAEIAGVCAAIVSFAAYPLYLIEFMGWRTRRTEWLWRHFGLIGGTRPHVVSWIVWSLLQVVIFLSAHQEGAGASNLLPLAHFAGSSLIAIFASQYGVRAVTRLDTACGISAIGSLTLFLFIDSPWWALLLAIVTEFLAGLPTLIGVMKNPRDESLPGWTLFFLGGLLNLCACQGLISGQLSLHDSGYTIYILLFTGCISLRLWWARWSS